MAKYILGSEACFRTSYRSHYGSSSHARCDCCSRARYRCSRIDFQASLRSYPFALVIVLHRLLSVLGFYHEIKARRTGSPARMNTVVSRLA
ncbi:hypothetical protein BDW67DRAFT_165952 [Aspergillus spinulosporus]